MIKMAKKRKTVTFKSYMSKIKSLLMIYVDSESPSVPKNNWRQNPNESYPNNHDGFSFDYKLVYVDDQFRKSLNS